MAHLRQRYISSLLKDIVKFSPITGILGHRQVGKTTLLESACKDYRSMDDETEHEKALISAKKYISNLTTGSVGIDECQLVPNLFPALKEQVRKNKRPGQFILSGSVRFTGRKVIKESLTGRIVNLELLPFSVTEIKHLPLSDSINKILFSKDPEHVIKVLKRTTSDYNKIQHELELYKKNGGLPGVCFIRNEKLRGIRISEQLDTILDRDLRMIYSTTLSLAHIKDLLSLLSQHEGKIIQFSDFERKIKISEATLKKLLYAFENLFLIRTMQVIGDRKGVVVYFEDQAEDLYLSDSKKSDLSYLQGLVYRNIRTQWFYRRDANTKIYHYQTRANSQLPFVIQIGTAYLGILVIESDVPTRSELAICKSFLAGYENSKIVITGENCKSSFISSRIFLLSLCDLI
jgi:predicted AAA+ superfamily ATPase